MAMLPAAPAVFSTSTVWPSVLPMRSASSRAMVSVGPPAENGTTRVTGRLGKPCAAAMFDASARSARNRNLMHPPLVAAETNRRVALDLVHQRDFPAQVLARVLLVVGGVIVRLVPDIVALRRRALRPGFGRAGPAGVAVLEHF